MQLVSLVLLAGLASGSVLGLSACSTPDAAEPSASSLADSVRTFTDDIGRTVTLPPVRRIVSLAPNLTEIAFAAGAGAQVVAVGRSDDYPPAVDTLPHVSVLPVDVEAIVAHEPDLVLATTQVNAARDADTFDAVSIPSYYFSFPTLQSVFDAIRRMGELAGTPEAARDSSASLQEAFARIQARTDSILAAKDSPTQESVTRPSVLVLAGSDVLYSFGASSYIQTMVEAAGGRSVTRSLENAAPTLSEEFVLRSQPDVIVGAFGTDSPAQTLLSNHPSFDIVPAIETGRVYNIDSDLLFRPGPRLVSGTDALSRLLFPDVFSSERQGAP